MATVSPSEFESVALAWLTTVSVVIGALVTALITIVPKIAALRQAMQDNAQRLDDHSKRITENSSRVMQVALAVEPPKKDEKSNKSIAGS